MAYNYSKLLGKIKEKFGTQEQFAEALGMSRTTLSLRLNCKQQFSQSEIDKATTLLNLDKSEIPDYFFAAEV